MSAGPTECPGCHRPLSPASIGTPAGANRRCEGCGTLLAGAEAQATGPRRQTEQMSVVAPLPELKPEADLGPEPPRPRPSTGKRAPVAPAERPSQQLARVALRRDPTPVPPAISRAPAPPAARAAQAPRPPAVPTSAPRRREDPTPLVPASEPNPHLVVSGVAKPAPGPGPLVNPAAWFKEPSLVVEGDPAPLPPPPSAPEPPPTPQPGAPGGEARSEAAASLTAAVAGPATPAVADSGRQRRLPPAIGSLPWKQVLVSIGFGVAIAAALAAILNARSRSQPAPVVAPPRARPAPAPAVAAPQPSPPPTVVALPAAAEPPEPAHARAHHLLGGKRVVLEYDPRPTSVAPPRPTAPTPAGEDPQVLARAREAYHRGNVELFAGDTARAVAAYRESLRIYPGYVAGYRGLGLAFSQAGQKKDALASLHLYLRTVPNAHDASIIRRRIRDLEKR